jgi:hypothetical protein
MRLRGLDWSELSVQGCARAVRAVSATWTGTIIVDAFDAKTMAKRRTAFRRADYLLGSSAGFTYVSTNGP